MTNPSLNITPTPSSWWNWSASAANAGTPAFNPNSPTIFTPTNVGNIFNTNPSGGGSNNPFGLMTNSGVLVQDNNKLNSILNSILSSFAIFKGAQHIPTQLPVNSGGYGGGSQAIDPAILAALYAQNDGSTGGNMERWLKDNWLPVGVVALVFVAWMSKSPRQSR